MAAGKLSDVKWADIPLEDIMAAVEESMCGVSLPGFCRSCGAEADNVEPDARNVTCEICACPAVFGAEELLMMVA